ncbi:MAG TPA: cytochrome c peroxidase [Candidatus Polarisedimenticolaceae bacterium]|nr:cytochrome c peroxidase [Candidatus Polarisedimenticolaceae bacterium]
MRALLERRGLAAALAAFTGIGIAAYAAGGETPHRASYEYGRDLFFHETFDGNGRTCATCHDPRNEFTVSPELVEQRFQSDPAHPLFRPQDSDDGAGRDYTTLRTLAVFRVTIPLHPNVILPENPSQRTITVWRGVPGVANVELTAPYLQDGRSPTLQGQARGAILGHMAPKRPPTPKELDALAAFETELYYPLRLRAVEDDTDPLPKPAGFSIPVVSPAAQRGQAVFDLHCRTCHDGETLSVPAAPDTRRFASVFVSERNAPRFAMLHLAFRQPDGSYVETYTPDPGRAAITGDLQDLNAFDIPSLRGLKHTAPYFHDNSAATLGDVIDHYNDHFQFQITPAQRDDLLAFLELL